MTFSHMPIMDQDRISGAAEIEQHVIDRLAAVHREGLPDLCQKILSRYPAMGSLWFIANSSFLGGDKASRAFKGVQQAGTSIVNNAFSVLKDGMTIATYSRSSTVKDILVHNRRMIRRVICSESRPHFEGRRLAQELSHEGIPITLTTDAGLFDQIITADLVLMGADAFVGATIVNKVGTGAVMQYAGELGLPMYVAAASHKAFPFVFIKEEDGNEVWGTAPSEIVVHNVYFGTARGEKPNAFVTERGIVREVPRFQGEISPEVLKIKETLLKKDRYSLIT